MLPPVKTAFKGLAAFFTGVFQPSVSDTASGFLSFGQEALGSVITALETHVLPALKELWAAFHDQLWPTLRDDIIPLFIDFATRGLQNVGTVLTDIVIPVLVELFDFIKVHIVPIFNTFMGIVEDLADLIFPKIKAAIENVVGTGAQWPGRNN